MKSLSLKIFISILVILILVKVIYSFNVEYKRGLSFDHTTGNVVISLVTLLVFFLLFKWFKK